MEIIKKFLSKLSCGDIGKEEHQPFKDVTDDLLDLYTRKSGDYGDTSEKMAAKYGEMYWTMMIQQKVLRIEALDAKGGGSNCEEIEDSYRDIANYAILALINHKRQNF